MTDRYAVMGHPIAHSRSPFIHACFAAETGEELSYEAIHVEPGNFARAVADFAAAGGRGVNVTLPFKEEAWALAIKRTPRAQFAGAVNTLCFEDGVTAGDNTDGVGMVRDIAVNQGWPLAGCRVLLLGAGGAARGVLAQLLEAGPTEVVIANRTAARAVELSRHFDAHAGACQARLQACPFERLAGKRFDLVINATAASLEGDLPPLPDAVLAENGACYDMVYGASPTPFLRWGIDAGAARTADGAGMLVEQAAESFLSWRGVRPQTAPVIDALRAQLLQTGQQGW